MEPLKILHDVATKLEHLKIPYMVGGSFAGSYYGFAQNTQGADVIVSLKLENVEALVNAFSKDFYLDGGTIEDALRRRPLSTSFTCNPHSKWISSSCGPKDFNKKAFCADSQPGWILSSHGRHFSNLPRIRCWPSSIGIARAAKSPSCSGAMWWVY
jgi:hypothetical protein